MPRCCADCIAQMPSIYMKRAFHFTLCRLIGRRTIIHFHPCSPSTLETYFFSQGPWRLHIVTRPLPPLQQQQDGLPFLPFITSTTAAAAAPAAAPAAAASPSSPPKHAMRQSSVEHRPLRVIQPQAALLQAGFKHCSYVCFQGLPHPW